MLVRFEGQGELSFEYNGRRFFFNRNTPPVDIPYQIYDYVKKSGTVESTWLRPCEAPQSPVPGQDKGVDYESLIEQKDIRISELERENKKLLDRIEKLQKQNIEERKEKKKK